MILYDSVPLHMGSSLKRKNLLQDGAYSFLYGMKVTFITFSDLPWMLLILLRTRRAFATGASVCKMYVSHNVQSVHTCWCKKENCSIIVHTDRILHAIFKPYNIKLTLNSLSLKSFWHITFWTTCTPVYCRVGNCCFFWLNSSSWNK